MAPGARQYRKAQGASQEHESPSILWSKFIFYEYIVLYGDKGVQVLHILSLISEICTDYNVAEGGSLFVSFKA